MVQTHTDQYVAHPGADYGDDVLRITSVWRHRAIHAFTSDHSPQNHPVALGGCKEVLCSGKKDGGKRAGYS